MGNRSLHDEYLLTCPTMEPQRACAICGRTDRPIEMHHVVPRSRTTKRLRGPVVPLCGGCHHHHHSVSPYEWDYRDGSWYANGKKLWEMC